jgi:adenylylsulfate kinase
MFGKIGQFFKLVTALVGIHRNPAKVENFFRVSDSLLALGAFNQMRKILERNPDAVRIVAERKLFQRFTLEELSRFPDGSLAKVFAEHMIHNKLDPDFYPPLEIRTDEHYIIMRMRQCHDFLHVLLGFDTSEEGELGLQGFLMAQLASPLSMLLIGGTLLASPFKKQEKFFPYLGHAFQGWQMGRKAKPVFAFDYEANWHRPLTEVRRELGLPEHPTAPDISPVPSPGRSEPAVLWLTGLSAAGKTTVAEVLAKKLRERNLNVEVLDGDSIRNVFPNTGFSRAEREEHVKRVGHLASRLEKHGVWVISSLISPYQNSRDFVRGLCRNFYEIHLSTPLAVCESRDPKGLYKKARRGEIKNFTGLDDPYEAPARAEITVDTSHMTPEQAAERILQTIGLPS